MVSYLYRVGLTSTTIASCDEWGLAIRSRSSPTWLSFIKAKLTKYSQKRTDAIPIASFFFHSCDHPIANSTLKCGIERLLDHLLPRNTAIFYCIKAMMPLGHHINGEVIRNITIKDFVQLGNVFYPVNIYVILTKQQQSWTFDFF